jgi:hypothetical protein
MPARPGSRRQDASGAVASAAGLGAADAVLDAAAATVAQLQGGDIGGVATWIVVSTTLADQMIVVSDDASCLAGDEVDGPFSASCEAMVIDKHALEATGGLRYAELDREDPKRQTAMTASFLQASLFTSVVAFGVAAIGVRSGRRAHRGTASMAWSCT